MHAFETFRALMDYDLVGILPLDCFAGLPAEEDPRSLFPDARSVVVLGSRLPRGHFRSMEEGSLWRTCGRWLTDLDRAIRRIEAEGYECVPYAPVAAARMPRGAVRPGQCAARRIRLSVEHAAVAAGLGDIGYHGMFMSPRFGIRQMLGLLVTDMPIEPGPGAAAMADVCDGCLECVKACPLDAISTVQSSALTCGDRRMLRGTINAAACALCPNGACADSTAFAGAEELHQDIENNQVKGEMRPIAARGSLPNRLAAACGRACIAHFEATRKTGYRIPFRNREPWGFRPDTPRGW